LKLKHIGLFEGIGGFSLAAKWMGWDTIAWCEIEPFCQKVLNYHFPNAKQHNDIKTTDFTIYRGECDILTGGFPCQPYSLAGKRKGKEDERNLWPSMYTAIREIQPRWVVAENVYGFINWNRGMVFNEVQADLEASGYEVWPYVLPACAVNAPHLRNRIFFVATYPNSSGGGKIYNQVQPELANGTIVNSIGSEWVDTNTDGERLQGRKHNGSIGETRQAKTYSGQFIGSVCSKWENFPTQSPVCSRDDGLPNKLDGITFSRWRKESIKAYGNAIVPQVAYEIFKAINLFEKRKNLLSK
jgi:DNA (cytosine-5)-methyltransferase 1